MALNLLFYDSYLYTLLAPFFESKNWPQIVHLEIMFNFLFFFFELWSLPFNRMLRVN